MWLETHATELSLPELNLVDEHLEAPVVPGHVAGEGGSNAGKRARAPVVGQLLGGGRSVQPSPSHVCGHCGPRMSSYQRDIVCREGQIVMGIRMESIMDNQMILI